MILDKHEKIEKKDWRKSAIAIRKNILGEIPLLRPFFLESLLWNALSKSLYTGFMFFGETVSYLIINYSAQRFFFIKLPYAFFAFEEIQRANSLKLNRPMLR